MKWVKAVHNRQNIHTVFHLLWHEGINRNRIMTGHLSRFRNSIFLDSSLILKSKNPLTYRKPQNDYVIPSLYFLSKAYPFLLYHAVSCLENTSHELLPRWNKNFKNWSSPNIPLPDKFFLKTTLIFLSKLLATHGPSDLLPFFATFFWKIPMLYGK